MKHDVTERLLAQAWRRQSFKRRSIRTVDGRRVRIAFPGRQNTDSGPDFCDAIIILEGGTQLKGDVELHVRSRDWHAHGHDRDPNYNGVILHVVMWNDGGEATMLQSGTEVPILALFPYVGGGVEHLRLGLQDCSATRQPCRGALDRRGRRWLDGLLDQAGMERFYLKSKEFRLKLASMDPEEVLYRGVMRALGYAKNKRPFEELAGLLPLSVLRRFATRRDTLKMQALLLGTAGLLPSQRAGKGIGGVSGWSDPEAEWLQTVWETLDVEVTMSGLEWHFFRVRPENFPPRRIVAAGHLLSRHRGRLLATVISMATRDSSASLQRGLEQSFAVGATGYWASHYDFGRPARWNPSLIGRGRAREIVVNVLLPFLSAGAESLSRPWLGGLAEHLYRNHPPLGENWITRYMAAQVADGGQGRLSSACRQQGLIHLYRAYCSDRRCRVCPLG